jgi:alpha-D-xyloside xylohydrolase
MERTVRSWTRLLLLLVIAIAGSQVALAVETLESPALRLEVSTNPYSYRVLERSTGEVLIAESGAALRFGAELYPVTDATDIIKTRDTLRATLGLELAGRYPLPQGTPDRAEVSFRFLRPQILQVLISDGKGTPDEISEQFSDQGEHYYGIWEYPFGGNLDNRGADREFLGLGNQRYVHHASARAPFYMTSKKYGIYAETLAQGHYAIAQAGKTGFSFRDSKLKYDILYGPSCAEILSVYNDIAGPAFMPPTWAFGSIWWRDDEHEDLRGIRNAQEKVIQDADRLRELHIPAGAIWLDRPFGSGELGWGNMDFDSSFPDPPKMIRDLNVRGMNLLLWIANRCSSRLFQEGSQKGYLFPLKWPAADIRRPEVYSWWKDNLNAYVRLGIKGYKIDRGEENEMPDSFQNEQAVLFPKLAAEGLSAAYDADYFTFSRNVNDTSRKYTAVWNGDSWSSFSGLQVSIKNGLRAGAMNFPMWGSDTGGYFAPAEKDKELLARWLEFSALSPIMEVLLGPKRTLWDDYDRELVGIARMYTSLHHDLIPYTRSYMYEATRTGMPIMRALAFVFPGANKLADLWDEYLYGNDILVAPVTEPKAAERTVYLPAGKWMNYEDKRTVYEGETTIRAAAPLDMIPLFVRAGAIVPRGDIIKLNNNWETDWHPRLRIEVFPSANLSTQFNYFTGKGVEKINVASEGAELKIQFGDLGVNGVLEVYCTNPGGVTRNGLALREGADYHYDTRLQKLTVPFQSATDLDIRAWGSLFDSSNASTR